MKNAIKLKVKLKEVKLCISLQCLWRKRKAKKQFSCLVDRKCKVICIQKFWKKFFLKLQKRSFQIQNQLRNHRVI